MPMHEPMKASASDDAPPFCPTCQKNEHTTAIQVHDLSPGVQYWRCQTCRAVWATDKHGDRSIFAG
jgi:formate dehydrogenase maturation protein FdhE